VTTSCRSDKVDLWQGHYATASSMLYGYAARCARVLLSLRVRKPIHGRYRMALSTPGQYVQHRFCHLAGSRRGARARPLNVELPGETSPSIRCPHHSGKPGVRLVHIEFQGRSSRAPMRWRCWSTWCDWLSTTGSSVSVVIYVGYGWGAGYWTISSEGPTGIDLLSWQYEVIRHVADVPPRACWPCIAAALMPLVGQTRITPAAEVCPGWSHAYSSAGMPSAGSSRDGLLALLAE